MNSPAMELEQDARSERGWYCALARTGLVAKGISFGIVGALALKLALGDGGKATSREGALEQIAGSGWGKLLIGALALGFAAYAIWRFVQAFVTDKWSERAGYTGRGIIYAGLTYSACKLLVGAGGSGSQNERARKTTDTVLDWPGGKLLVIVGGLVIVGVGVWNLYRGVTKKFEKKWRHGYSTWGSRAGVAGHIARFVVFGLIGVFAIKAALDFDPQDAVGFDGALQKLAHASYGPALLGLTAAGLVAYGIYCLVDARYRDVTP
jgi:hypothetical protein